MKRGLRWTAVTAALCMTLAAMPAGAAEPPTPVRTWGETLASAVRAWLGELLVESRPEAPAASEKKQHVDNPGQTPMNDGD
jgi:hypothetical protein